MKWFVFLAYAPPNFFPLAMLVNGIAKGKLGCGSYTGDANQVSLRFLILQVMPLD